MWDDWAKGTERLETQSRGLSLALYQATTPLLGPPSLSLLRPSPGLWVSRAAWGLSASSLLPEELLPLSLSSEVPEALALGHPTGGAVVGWNAGTLGFLSLLAFAGVLWGLATGTVPRALSI